MAWVPLRPSIYVKLKAEVSHPTRFLRQAVLGFIVSLGPKSNADCLPPTLVLRQAAWRLEVPLGPLLNVEGSPPIRVDGMHIDQMHIDQMHIDPLHIKLLGEAIEVFIQCSSTPCI